MNSVITLTTDFGTADGYVASVKGVILGINPGATIVDISHQIQPQNIHQAAFVLGAVYSCFPTGTVHLVVVDPGVGTDRRIIIVRTPKGTFVGPDNGVLSYAFRDYVNGENIRNDSVSLTREASVISVTNRRFFREPVSDTFHGRDIMAPVTALLSQGFQPETFGEKAESLQAIPMPRPSAAPDGLTGHVIHVDSFGNIITDIRRHDLPNDNVRINIGGHTVIGLNRNYVAGQGLLTLIGSTGYLEIALNNGSAAAITGARIGDEIKVRTGA